jgi:hypothetical protein
LLALSLCACGSQEPSIEFTHVPLAKPGDPLRLESIEGRVHHAGNSQKIVLYAKSELWWIQPLADHPFTTVQADSTWKNQTHPGTEYAALLVDSDYKPASKTRELPPVGGGVRAVIRQPGAPSPLDPPHIVHFSGYEWEVRSQPSERGGTMNPYDPENVWCDDQAHLHLRTARQGEAWAGAEVQLTHSLGYGLYRFTVRDVSTLDGATALTLYTRDEAAPEQNNREIDIEVSRWGDPSEPNAQFVVPPFNEPANVSRFEAPPGQVAFSFRWLPGNLLFQAARGSATLARHEFTASVPSAGGELARINLYVYGHSRKPALRASEVVIEKFEYYP